MATENLENDTTSSPPRLEQVSQMTAVDHDGDLCLWIENSSKNSPYRYRVSSAALRKASRYFDNLLDPSRFREGIALAKQLEGLQSNGNGTSEETILPVLRVQDVETPTVSSSNDVLVYFLQSIHGQVDPERLSKQKFRFIFSLAVVADRFFAQSFIKSGMDAVHRSQEYDPQRVGRRLVDDRSNPDVETGLRQRILVGIWYEMSDWVQLYSHHLIINGSREWAAAADEPITKSDSFSMLWKDLPEGIEEELMIRRQYILETIASLQDDIIKLYLSKDRQCRLGYDNSGQCDLFQLGQALRFLHRRELVHIGGTIAGLDEHPAMVLGSLPALCAQLRAFSDYQIDSNHAHCGVRRLILPRIERIEALLVLPSPISLCPSCWRDRQRSRHQWSVAPVVKWTYRRHAREPGSRESRADAHFAHGPERASMFIARQRDWMLTGNIE